MAIQLHDSTSLYSFAHSIHCLHKVSASLPSEPDDCDLDTGTKYDRYDTRAHIGGIGRRRARRPAAARAL